MTTYKPRSAWTSTARGGDTLTDLQLAGVSVHYPASGNVTLANLTEREVIERLRGWRNYHVRTKGWSDIGYQVAIDGQGRVWDLRGIERVPAASASEANPDANREWGACLFIVGDNEQPTKAAIQAFREWRQDRWLTKWPNAVEVRGHGQVPGAQTACPGKPLRALIDNGILTLPLVTDVTVFRRRTRRLIRRYLDPHPNRPRLVAAAAAIRDALNRLPRR